MSNRQSGVFKDLMNMGLNKPSAKRKGPKTKKTANEKSQTLLNFGQKIPKVVSCPECRLSYNPLLAEDQELHYKHHNRVLDGIEWIVKRAEESRVIQQFPTGACILMLSLPDAELKAHERKRVAEILKIVDQELGSCGSDLDDLVQGQKIYLYISEKYRVQGCLQVEKIAEGFRVIPGHMATDLAANEQCCGSIIASRNKEMAVLGINRVWVSKNARRCGVASKLLNAARNSFTFGDTITLDRVAFSQPSEFGRQLAASYFQRPDFLVY